MCTPVEVIPNGLVIEAEPMSLEALERSLRDLLDERGGQIDSITFTRF